MATSDAGRFSYSGSVFWREFALAANLVDSLACKLTSKPYEGIRNTLRNTHKTKNRLESIRPKKMAVTNKSHSHHINPDVAPGRVLESRYTNKHTWEKQLGILNFKTPLAIKSAF